VTDRQRSPAEGVGSVAFDVADRLAIINLFGAYAHTHDDNRLDELLPDIETVMSLLAVRKAKFKAEKRFSRWVVAMDQVQLAQ
jgi:hypothetical protein